MIIWRISKNEYSWDLSGEGARLYGGRWNEIGVPMLYTSQHLSLSILEILTTIPVKMVNENYSYIKITIPEGIIPRIINVEDLGKKWNTNNASDYTKNIGSKWIKSNDSLILLVPSAIVPEEYNVLVNPTHKDFSKVKIEIVDGLILDSRFH